MQSWNTKIGRSLIWLTFYLQMTFMSSNICYPFVLWWKVHTYYCYLFFCILDCIQIQSGKIDEHNSNNLRQNIFVKLKNLYSKNIFIIVHSHFFFLEKCYCGLCTYFAAVGKWGTLKLIKRKTVISYKQQNFWEVEVVFTKWPSLKVGSALTVMQFSKEKEKGLLQWFSPRCGADSMCKIGWN